ncbi:hypothetical protein BJ875DRAFT_478861 [Amylocarpus encephaloides]|uniref:AMP-dependent synthetase/ligase domain-containing protein n=1 Tax=Amylocarpus encephaloides TaxID=45428 RepID=A0A9P8BZA3_9HELO|nr:hypothetical protein BJ875DRAFT_478861 [Amylocarpus encephaloides]
MFLSRKASSFLLSSFKARIIPRFWSTERQLSRMVSTLPPLPIFNAIASHDPSSTCVVHSASGRRFTYGGLLKDVVDAKDRLVVEAGGKSIEGERIAFLVENSYDYVVTLLSILGAHSIALPMSPAFPPHELQYIMDHSQASMLAASKKFTAKAKQVIDEGLEGTPKIVALEKKLTSGNSSQDVVLEGRAEGKGGMMLYTSGTTNRPKGVLLPTAVMTAQATPLIKAWNYTPQDYLLHVLPLHHIHGTVNAIFAPLIAGSTIEFLFPFNATAVWSRFAAPFLHQNGSDTKGLTNGHSHFTPKEKITFFTVVPTVYNRLLSTFSDSPPEIQTAAKMGISPGNLRLNISGSAALPTPTKKAWTDLSNGNVILERYGMTEVGMALSCALSHRDRADGSVGWPLPTVEARLADTETGEVIQPGQEIGQDGRERDGEIQLRGPTIFQEYWRNPEATAKEHVDGEDGKGAWFKTGDVAVRRSVPGAGQNKEQEDWASGPLYFIRGRLSSDIIKSGGEKVSALEVERELLSLPQIEEAAVVAVPSGKWGQKVGAVVVIKKGLEMSERGKGKRWGPLDMRYAMRERLAGYKIPQVMKIVEGIERNAMGKINKKLLVKKVFVDEASGDEM